MKDTNIIGARTEGQLLGALTSQGFTVLQPSGVARYDFVVDTKYGFKRLQCKTGRLKKGAITFSTVSVSRSGKNVGYTGDADFFGVFCPETYSCFIIPVDAMPVSKGSLRVESPKNGQIKDIKWASTYWLINRSQTGFKHPGDVLLLEDNGRQDILFK